VSRLAWSSWSTWLAARDHVHLCSAAVFTESVRLNAFTILQRALSLNFAFRNERALSGAGHWSVNVLFGSSRPNCMLVS
jgi:hypothetical protein